MNAKGLHEVTVSREVKTKLGPLLQLLDCMSSLKKVSLSEQWITCRVCMLMVNESISDFACSSLLSEMVTCHHSVSFPFPSFMFCCSTFDSVTMNYIMLWHIKTTS